MNLKEAWSAWLPEKILGYTVGKDKKQLKSFAPPPPDDGAVNLEVGGAYGTYLDLEGNIRNELELITKYRELAIQPECEAAVEDIVNEAVVMDGFKVAVELELSEAKHLSDKIKEKIYLEFQGILDMLNFQTDAHDIFRKWYVDGKIYYHMIVDEANQKQGIQELRYIDPRKIRKVREVVREPDANGVDMVKKTVEFYVYDEGGVSDASQGLSGIKITTDSIAMSNSGLYDHANGAIVSYLHKAIKPMNQLRMMEDALVIYRISRAPERRIFYIDVGNLPKAKAEQYLRDMTVQHRNKLVYDASTGEIKDDRKHMNMMEDYWLPRREGGRGTEITTLPGGQNLGELEDISYFQTKVYKSLNVPSSRLMEDNSFSLGRESEVTRDELKFSKFILRLRNKFLDLFDNMLKTQLQLKGVIAEDEWLPIKNKMVYKWAEDSYYREAKAQEILRGRLELARDVSDYTGKFYSIDYIRREVLQQTDEEIKRLDKEMTREKEKEQELAALGKGGMGGMEPEGGDLAWQYDPSIEAGYDASMTPDRSKKPSKMDEVEQQEVDSVLRELVEDIKETEATTSDDLDNFEFSFDKSQNGNGNKEDVEVVIP